MLLQLNLRTMDAYTISFLVSTIWVGPFWLAMLIKPFDNKTNRLLNTPLFFLAPIVIWFLILFLNPEGFIAFFNSGAHPEGIIAGIAEGLATKAGLTATWAHVVAGDIFATRWIWKDGVNRGTHIWWLRLAVFFGVLLMPIGVLLHLIFRNK